jgi:4-hydroxy-3-methylbut-2-en-1-yl diphosphate synthase IspG/GcpE
MPTNCAAPDLWCADEPLVECECCHELLDVFQMRVSAEGFCYCDRCSRAAVIYFTTQPQI